MSRLRLKAFIVPLRSKTLTKYCDTDIPVLWGNSSSLTLDAANMNSRMISLGAFPVKAIHSSTNGPSEQ